MSKSHLGGSKKKALDTISLTEGNIAQTIAVSSITNDGAIDVSQMTAKLMTAASFRAEFDKGLTCR